MPERVCPFDGCGISGPPTTPGRPGRFLGRSCVAGSRRCSKRWAFDVGVIEEGQMQDLAVESIAWWCPRCRAGIEFGEAAFRLLGPGAWCPDCHAELEAAR